MVGLEGYPLDDLEDASVIADEYRYLKKDMEKVENRISNDGDVLLNLALLVQHADDYQL